jgi:SsrA-binding protein
MANPQARAYNACAMAKPKKSKGDDTLIVANKKANHDYFIEDRFEAGLALLGWEVKSLRQKKVQLVDSHVIIKNGEAWLLGAQIVPLISASTHHVADPTRTRKLLLNRKELSRIFSGIQQKGYTCVCTRMYWKEHLIKCEIALAKGKHEYDKRNVEKDREWNIAKQRTMQIAAKR